MNARRPVRVAYCIDSFVVGGTELNAIRTAETLDPREFELRVFHFAADGPLRERYEALGLTLVHLPITNLYSPATARLGLRFARHLRRWDAEVVHTHDIYTNIFSAPWARIRGRGGVLSSRRWWYDAPRRGLTVLNRWSNRFADRILANSNSVARLLIEAEGVPESKVVEIPNFLEDQAFKRLPAAELARYRAEWHIPPSAFVVGTIARLAPVKNQSQLIRALALLDGEVHLVFVGEGPSRGELEGLAVELGIDSRVHFTGQIVTSVNLHQVFDVSALCSTSEGFPNSLIEALAAERAVVATPVGGVPDVISDGATGLLTPLADPAAMARTIDRLRGDRDLRAQLGHRGRELAIERYHRNVAIGKLSNLYHGLVRGSP